MKQYLDLLKDILDNGVDKMDRTGVGTRSIFGRMARYDLNQGFPIVTTKKIFLKAIIYELLWFLKGGTNIKYLKDHGVSIWDEWADADGELGPVYGAQWRNWNNEGIDQIAQLVNLLKTRPNDRRMIVTAWNPSQIEQMHLPPCHMFFQCYVANNKLSTMLYQRSCDTFLGVPFNIASYALLTMMLAKICGFELGEFVHVLGDTHIYQNHFDQVKLQLSREPFALPQMLIKRDITNIDDFQYEDFELVGYQSHPRIVGDVAV